MPTRYQTSLLAPDLLCFKKNEKDETALDLTISGRQTWRNVKIAAIFPLTIPDRYLLIRDEEGNEIGVVDNPNLIHPDSLLALRETIARTSFLPIVKRAFSIKMRRGILICDVETDRGRHIFEINDLRQNRHIFDETHLIVNDINGTRYLFPDINTLDNDLKKLLTR